MENNKIRLFPVTLLTMGKTLYFVSNDDSLKKDDIVICETTRGIEIGKIFDKSIIKESKNLEEYPPILRKGDSDDLKIHEINLKKAEEAIRICQKCADKQNLEMKVIASEFMFDLSKVIIYYLSENRVDFRDLLKELALEFHCRIELRQVGSRDKAKLIGGIGVCGLKLCCTTFLNEFDGISITMAKNQMLALNIPKLSGQCGKLMCCLKYENDTYSDLQNSLPRIGSKVKYKDQIYKITSMNVITQVIRLENRDEVVNVNYEEIKDNILPKDTPLSSNKGDN
ncbi:MAG: regulatory iron-sulfur-containing complex subunit RicT [Bacillales bacterium]|nr:regulatory iron-sulfur-containing complex subunit RicT [Bacillales bacterium]